MTTIREYYRQTALRLREILGSQGEGDAAASIIFDDVVHYSRTFIFANGDREITPDMQARIAAVVAKIATGEPVQYAIGHARFMGNDFIVTPDVLIPRPETAGLVDMIVDQNTGRSDLSVLDIGTGSGCIAISLARTLAFSRVSGIDISEAAIKVAEKNAKALKVKADFYEADILKLTPQPGDYDIIVSNPPYIAQSEATEMEARVLDYEPHTALFVPDSDPLRFYKAIAEYGRTALRAGGKLYFEINSRYADAMYDLLTYSGYQSVSIERDYKGNYRYAIATQI